MRALRDCFALNKCIPECRVFALKFGAKNGEEVDFGKEPKVPGSGFCLSLGDVFLAWCFGCITECRLDSFVDFDIGGYGSEAYPKGTLLRVARERASEKHKVTFGEDVTVYVADSPRDVDAARIGGAKSLAVASGRASAAELRDAGADAVLPDLTDTAGLTALIVRLTEAPSR